MTEHIPTRRRKAPVRKAAAPDAVQPAEAVPVPKAQRRRRSDVITGGLKLYAPEKPGFRRRFVNDKGNKLAEAQELGYTFAEAPDTDTHGPGSRINRLAGTQESGAPLKTYLMETPVELWEQGMREKEEERAEVDLAINRGSDPVGETDGRFSYRPEQVRHSSITVERG